MREPNAGGEGGAGDERWARAAIAVALVWLAARLLWLAFHVDPALPPDELTHAGMARHQVAFWGWPQDTEASYPLGLVSHRPFLYGWVLARWLALQPGALVSDLVWMRLANVAMAFGSVLAGLAFARRAGASPGARVCFVVVLTNLPMWSFLSASVSYDNLAMCLGTLGFAQLARYLDAPSPRALLALKATVLLGVLTKAAFVPLALLFAAAGLVVRRGAALGDALRAATGAWRAGATQTALAALVLALGVITVALYGTNLVRFGVLEPAANQVLPLEAALQNRIFRQEHVLRSFRAGAIDFRTASEEIAAIEHEGDRAGAMWMLRRALELRRGEGEPLVGRLRYAGLWTALMAERLFGVMGHRELYKGRLFTAAYAVVSLAALAALLARWRAASVHVRIAACIAAAYALVLMQLVNYPIYRATGLAVEAVQGRYLFPVLGALVAALATASRDALPERARWPAGLAVCTLFVLGDFPYFLYAAGDSWVGTP